jgi:predicted nuclease of predicted toxin-antitoxin system
VKILLDENFPLPLYHRLRAAGHDVEHIIVLGQRGLPDSAIRQRIAAEEMVFLTQDTEFEEMPASYRATVIISRVRQSLPIQQRVQIWFNAVQGFLVRRPAGKLFDLLETGEIIPWEVHELPREE